jgi:hypothetical protein
MLNCVERECFTDLSNKRFGIACSIAVERRKIDVDSIEALHKISSNELFLLYIFNKN